MFLQQSKSYVVYLNWNQQENLNRRVERYWFKVKLWYCYFLTNVDYNNIIISLWFQVQYNSLTFLHQSDQFSENREKQRKAYERKKKFSAAIKKDKLIWVFPCGKKGAFKFKVKKSFRCCMSNKGCFGTFFAIVSVKLSISLLLKEKKFKIYYDVVIFWPKLMMTIL